ncbi:MAG: nucleotidyltransferase domain-containing protein [Lachnospiraceae bacterium]|nr:nucleotidyltransferase domain-containing protein [Lachnospiraceae bacterium]
MTIEHIRQVVMGLIDKYHISRVTLFGSRAGENYREDSDVDLIMEFSRQISLITLASITNELEELLQLKVDVIHGPIRDDDILEIKNEVVLYAA